MSEENGASSQYFGWTEERKYTLAKLVHRHAAYKKTSVSFKDKFDLIYIEMKSKKEFADLSISSLALQNTFKRDQGVVLVKYGISKEAVNLSGLESEPSAYEKLLLDMAEEEYKEKRKRKIKTEKIKVQKRVSDNICEEGLRRQGEIQPTTLLQATDESVLTSPLTTSTESSVKSKTFNPFQIIDDLTKTISEQFNQTQSDADAEEKELQKALIRAQIRAAEAAEEASKKQTLYYSEQLKKCV